MENKTTKPSPNRESKFSLGAVFQTAAIAHAVQKGLKEGQENSPEFIQNSLMRHESGDWGDCCQEDKEINDEALANQARIFTVFNVPTELKTYFDGAQIWIITEASRLYCSHQNTKLM